MTRRDNHYEAAFEEYLRSRRVPYVAVDEAKRAKMGDGTLKSLDFIVSAEGSGSWLVDVKGRRFPSGQQKQYWKNWSTRDDLRSLSAWQDLFGSRFHSIFVFAYNIVGDRSPLPEELLFPFRDNRYAFVGIRLDEYAASAHRISQSWGTVAMPTARFRQLAAPIEDFF